MDFAADVAVKWTCVDVADFGISRTMIGGSITSTVTINTVSFPSQESIYVSSMPECSVGSVVLLLVVEAKASSSGLMCSCLRE